MAAPRSTGRSSNPDEKSIPSLVNAGYFSDYYLGYRLDAGLSDLYLRWDSAEKNGDSTARTRVRGLGAASDKFRVEAALTAPEQEALDEGRLDLRLLPVDAVAAQLDLNDAILEALGWKPARDEAVELTTGDQTVTVPAASRCDTHSGTLLLALHGVFSTDPAAIVAGKDAPAGRLIEPVQLAGKPVGRTALEAAQLIFTADDPPSYLLIVSGGSVVLLDRDRWGEGVYLGANLDDAIARHDTKPKGELAVVAALFSADAINPGAEAQSVLAGLLERAASESAGVSKDLRYGMRRSVELLANAVVFDMRERQKVAWTSIDPADLTRQCLRYLYRIVVLLFAEARPELGILPADDPDYQAGYSVARLRDTALVDLQSDHARRARHIQASLDVLFRLVNEGHRPDATLSDDARDLEFPGLRSTLFGADACSLVDRSHLHDDVLQQVLAHLCFTKEKPGALRQSVSYSTLGVNQLGAVYEGLMSYSGFIATEPLYEIDKDGDPDNGSWVIPVTRAQEFPDEVFLTETAADGSTRRVQYREGDFVFRLSGRDRQRSASYYTPEVLTEFTVRHALDVLFQENPDLTSADVLEVTICEPALGSGAFANEAINQLAARYLKLAQDERGETIDADRYQHELQKAKAHFAVNQVYGVDLNQTAVDLAEVSLWLNCMHPGLTAPWFGARLRRGNSLIGARRATYTVDQAKKAAYTGKTAVPPTDQSLATVPLGQAPGIHHFLLPGEGWGAAATAKEVKELDPAWVEAVKTWQKAIAAKPNDRQLARLQQLAARAEQLWAQSAAEVAQFWQATRHHVDVWGHDTPPSGSRFGDEAIRRVLFDPRSATYRLRTVMNAWCSLWLWAPQHGTALPSFEQWLTGLEALLRVEDRPITPGVLFNDERELNLTVEETRSVDEAMAAHPWLATCQAIAEDQGWFHWELEFSPVFERGGFDLQVGNPPWVRLDWDDIAALADLDPLIGVTDSKSMGASLREQALATGTAQVAYLAARSEVAGLSLCNRAASRWPDLVGISSNVYLTFIASTSRNVSGRGTIGLVHPSDHLTDSSPGTLRASCYERLRRYFSLTNELKYFDIGNTNEFAVNVYSRRRPGDASFIQIARIIDVKTADRSVEHDGGGEVPSQQFADGSGWDRRPHAQRVIRVDNSVLTTMGDLDPSDSHVAPRILRPVVVDELSTASAMFRHPSRVADLQLFIDPGIEESSARKVGTLRWTDGLDGCAWRDITLQGPFFRNSLPVASQPRYKCKSFKDYDDVALYALAADFTPRTSYEPAGKLPRSDRYRVAWRRRTGQGLVRSLQAAIIPPGPVHVDSVQSAAAEDPWTLIMLQAVLSSLLADFLVKLFGKGDLRMDVIGGLPAIKPRADVANAIALRVCRLNCLTSAYSSLVSTLELEAAGESFGAGSHFSQPLQTEPSVWHNDLPLRFDGDRWLAECDLDALVALVLGVTANQLCSAYRSEFSVLRRYENATVFDVHGHRVAASYHHAGTAQTLFDAVNKDDRAWSRVQAYIAGDTSVDLGPFQPPFVPADREKAMTTAYWAFVDRYGLTPPDLEERPA